MTLERLAFPRVTTDEDPLPVFAAFHDATRRLAAWMPTIVDERGHAAPTDARWLRAFLTGPLRWHFHDVEASLLPRLAERKSEWFHACLARAAAKHAHVVTTSDALASLAAALAHGGAVSRQEWLRAASRLSAVLDDAVQYDDDIVLPSARLFVDLPARLAIAREVAAADADRPWRALDISDLEMTEVHAVHAVRATTCAGLTIVRSYATCPRGRTISTDACHGCPHLRGLSLDDDGAGTVTCAVASEDAATVVFSTHRVRDAMNQRLACIETTAPLADALRALEEASATSMIAVDAMGRVKGTIARADVLDVLATGACDQCGLVEDVMTPAFVVHEDASLDDVARALVTEGAHGLPVVDADGVGVGVITMRDVLRTLAGDEPDPR